MISITNLENKGSNNESAQYKLILTSRGLPTSLGKKVLKKTFEKERLVPGSIFLMTLPKYGVDEAAVRACRELGFTEIYLAGEYEGKDIREMPEVDAVYATEGNMFEVADYARKHHFHDYIKFMVLRGATYIGASAGAVFASASFKEAENFDKNFLKMTDFQGLCLLPGDHGLSDTVIPHYTFKQLKTYMAGVSGEERARYRNLYNICDDEALILDCKKTEKAVELLKKRRIRVESGVI